MMRFALSVELQLRCPSSRQKAGRYTAETALERRDRADTRDPASSRDAESATERGGAIPPLPLLTLLTALQITIQLLADHVRLAELIYLPQLKTHALS